jgi:hypothetical protein
MSTCAVNFFNCIPGIDKKSFTHPLFSGPSSTTNCTLEFDKSYLLQTSFRFSKAISELYWREAFQPRIALEKLSKIK